jgi:hypothetical protein
MRAKASASVPARTTACAAMNTPDCSASRAESESWSAEPAKSLAATVMPTW